MKVSRTGGGREGGLPRNPHARRSKLKMAALIFWRPFQDSCRVAMVEPPVSYLEPHGPPPLQARQGVSIGTAGCGCLGFVVRSLFDHRLPSCTISAGPPPSWQEKRPPQTSWMLAPKRTATSGERTGKRTAVETSISTWTRLRKIKMQRWVTM